jgi:hypothetical protein
MKLWHCLKYFWIASAVATGWFAKELFISIEKSIFFGGFLVWWFALLRWTLFEGLMDKWAGRE